MSYFDSKYGLCTAVGEGHLRLMCTTNNEYLVRWVKMKSKQKYFWDNRPIKQAMKLFSEDCDLNLLELCKNDNEVLTKFYYIVIQSEIAKINKKQFKGKDKGKYKDGETEEEYIQVVSNLIGIGIAVYDSRNKLIANYNPNQYIYKLDCIKIKKSNQVYSYIETQASENLNVTVKYTNCEYCLYEDAVCQSCSHSYHPSCILQLNSQICLICKSSLKELSCARCSKIEQIHSMFKCSCNYCLKNLILSLNGLSYCFACVCSKRNLLTNFCPLTSFKCECCKSSYPASEFLLFLCPDQHNYLCKSCWVNAITQKAEDHPLLCPLSGANLLQYQKTVKELLTSICSYCKNSSIEFHSSLSCPNKCQVCYSCQSRLINLPEKSPACINCKQILKK